MIRSFADKDTARIFHRERKLPPTLHQAARRRLLVVHGAEILADLKVPPGNRLEKLRGDRAGQYSIRINQRRICFRWQRGDAHDVEIVDYH